MTVHISGFKGDVRTPVKLDNITGLYALIPNHNELPRAITSAMLPYDQLADAVAALTENDVRDLGIEITEVSYLAGPKVKVTLDVTTLLEETDTGTHYQVVDGNGRTIVEFEHNGFGIQYIGGIPKELRLHGLVVWNEDFTDIPALDPKHNPTGDFTIPQDDVTQIDNGDSVTIRVPVLHSWFGSGLRYNSRLATHQALAQHTGPKYKHQGTDGNGDVSYTTCYKGKEIHTVVELVDRYIVHA